MLATQRPLTFLFASLIAVVLMASGARFLTVETDYEVFFDGINPRLQAHLELEDIFGRNDYVQLAVTPPGGSIFTPEVMAAVEDITERFWTIPHSRRVDSITNYPYTYAEFDDLNTTPMFEDATSLSDQDWQERTEFALTNVATKRNLVSDKGDITGITAMILLPDGDSLAPMEVDAFVNNLISEIQADYPELQLNLTGSIAINAAFFDHATREFATLLVIGVIMLLIASGFILRSVYAAVSIGALMGTSVLAGLGSTGWIGWPLTAPSSSSSIIIMAVSVASTVHLVSTFLKRLDAGTDKIEAINLSARQNFAPIALTTLTTAIGFLCLNLSDVPPYRLLGNTTAIGVVFAFILAYTLLPTLLYLLPFKARQSRAKQTNRWAQMGAAIASRPAPIALGSLIVIVLVGLPITRNVIDDRLLNYFDTDIPIRYNTDYIMENYTRFYATFIPVPSAGEQGVTDPEYLNHLDNYLNWCRQQPEVMLAIGFSDIIKQLNKNMNGDDDAFYTIPDDKQLVAQYLLLYEMSLPFGKDLTRDIDSLRQSSQAHVGFYNVTSAEMRDFERRSGEWMKANWPEHMHTHLAGPPILFAHIWHDATVSNLYSMGLAILVICTLIGLTMRSLKLGFISLAPNILPALMAFGVWGMFNGQIDIGSSIVAVIAFGIIVDDTIHFLHRYRHFRQQGKSYEEAIAETFSAIGTALTTTTIVLALGFGVLSISGFTLNSSMGMLTSITIVLALIVDLIFLPALLGVIDKRKNSAS